jgi:uncharacterized membrane protein
MTNRSGLSHQAWIVTWACWCVLFLQQSLDALANGAPWFIWAFKLLPLSLFFRGMLRDNLRSYIWLCFVCLGYFLLFVQRLFVTPTDLLLITGMVALVLLFVSSMLYVRWRARELRGEPSSQSDNGS